MDIDMDLDIELEPDSIVVDNYQVRNYVRFHNCITNINPCSLNPSMSNSRINQYYHHQRLLNDAPKRYI
jgi:hypothetical protein